MLSQEKSILLDNMEVIMELKEDESPRIEELTVDKFITWGGQTNVTA